MNNSDGFIDKFLKYFDRLDDESKKKCVSNLIAERDFLYSILNTIPDGVFLCDKQMNAIFINTSLKNILVRPESEKNIPIRKMIEDNSLYECVANAIKNNFRLIDSELHILVPKSLILLVSIYPLYSLEQETPHAYLCVLHDKNCERNLSQEERDRHLSAITKLTAGIAHEIGNPLNTINLYLELLRTGVENKDKTQLIDWINVILEETSRLDKIVKNFLQMTRANIIPIKKAQINQCVENALSFLRPELESRTITIHLDLSEDIPSFYFDPEKMYQAFLNILINAMEAIPQINGEISISTSISDNIVNIEISDNGVGIPENEVQYIFDAYHTTKKDGSGLGLMNVYNIIRDHGGRVYVETEEGRGTTFMISLPMRREKLQLPHFENND